jgi:epoxyqueuosine reductase QueG
MPNNLEKQIEQIIISKMADLNRPDLFRRPLLAFSAAADAKYAELKQIIGEWHLNPQELLPTAQSVISYFVPFTKPVVADPKAVQDGSAIWHEAYVIINNYFDEINQAIVEHLNSLGFSTQAIQATNTFNAKDLKSMWSHRSAAAIAALGIFGANGLLITEKGSGGRFCAVLTSAPLAIEQKPVLDKCLYLKDGSCGLCIEICPVKAFIVDENNKSTCDKFVCLIELKKNDQKQREATGNFDKAYDTCGKCISICPLAYIE